MIVIQETVLFGLIGGIIILGLVSVMFFFSLKAQAPEAFVIWKARRKKLPIAMVHYPEGTVRLKVPEVEKGNPEATNPYYVVPDVGIKFRNPDGNKIERLENTVPVYHYFKNIPESVMLAEVVAFHQLKDYFKKKGENIEGIEDLAFYVASENEKHTKSGRVQEDTIEAMNVEREDLRRRATQFLEFIEEHRKEIEEQKLQSGMFTFSTAMQALDSTIAFTSSHVAHVKSIISQRVRESMERKQKDIITYGVFVFMICLGAGVFLKVGGFV